MRRLSSGRWLAVVCSVVLLSAPACAIAAEPILADSEYNLSSPTADETPYIIGPQNMIQVKIFGEADANQIYRVDESGYIRHALAGRIKLGGLAVDEAERLLESKLGGDYYVNPKVTIFILEHSMFSILGEVRRPGNYEISGRISIIRAVSLAGGFTPVANQRGVKIVRKQPGGAESTIEVDVTRITRGDLSGQQYLEADDVVVVPKSFF